jgi:XTP/dITP diphosphohydrolase
MKLLLATRNAHKVKELAEMLKGTALEVLPMPADLPEVDEDQPTLEGNAGKKALSCAKASGQWSLADDTGLEVGALGGAPGVYSARYAGPGCSYADNNAKLLRELAGKTDRSAVFRTVMALASPRGDLTLAEGRVAGRIAESASGAEGFGYDPVFVVEGKGRTYAQMSLAEKNALSHRGRALAAMLPHLKKLVLLLLLAVPLAAVPASAKRAEPGQETIWDQIMASQAHRGLRQGSRFLDLKQYDLALKEFQRAVQANPKDAMAHMMLGAALYWNGDVDGSLAAYAKSLELDPDNAQAHMLVGISQAWKGEQRASYAAFKRAAELDPSRADIQMNIGSIEETLGMVPEALEHFRRAVSLEPKNPLYHFQLGMLYRKLGRDAEAVESMRLALRNFPNFEDALLELGAAEERRGDRKEAIRSFRKAVDLKSRDSVARFRLGRLLLGQGEVKKAREVLGEAFHLTPEQGEGGLQLSVSYAGGKSAAAGSSQQPAKKPAEEPAPSNDPLDVFKKNLERVPLDRGAVMKVDVAHVPKPKLVKASEGALSKALAKELAARPSVQAVRREYQLRPAKPSERAAEIAKVMEDLRSQMKQAPPDSDTRLGMNLTFTSLQDAPRAPSGEAPKVSYQPRDVGNDLGLWVMGTGWMALVEEVLPEGLEAPSHPDQADWWVATGLGFATVGEGQKALTSFERAVELDPKSELGHLGRGVAGVMLGQEASAASSLKRALELNPKNKAANEGLKWLQRPSTAQK